MMVFDMAGLVFGVLGAILVGQKNRWGFIGFIAGSISHGLLGVINGNPGLAATCGLFILIDIYYFYKWGKKECIITKGLADDIH